jgi:SAM-dependent methyltransferase
MSSLIERAGRLQEGGIFLGGPPELFESGGRLQLVALLKEGLNPASKVLDIGCGCLRGGYWLIHFLDPGCYFGIEPNREMLDAGIATILEPGLVELKQPRFESRADFDFSVFGVAFDYLLARSIWSHASKSQIVRMLDGFVEHAAGTAVFLTSYLPAGCGGATDYSGEGWVGRSHECDAPGIVHHDLAWIERECAARGLRVEELADPEANFGGQVWLRIRRSGAPGQVQPAGGSTDTMSRP